MDHEKAYNEALEQAKKELSACGSMNCDAATLIFRLFPELKESVAERTRKELLDYLNERRVVESLTDTKVKQEWVTWLETHKYTEEDLDKAYKCADKVQYTNGYNDAKKELEKPNEQKFVNKAKPKFNIGDWIVKKDGTTFYNGKTAVQIKHIYENRCLFDDSTYVYAEEVRLWTIQDAKSGDILTKSKRAFIFKDFSDSKHPGCPTAYCGINCENEFYTDSQENNRWTESKKVKPANEEQCNLLFKKMKEAGYEWNKHKKELKKK